MSTYTGLISGIGDSKNRTNEVTADHLASLRYFMINHDYGVMKYDDHDFDCSEDEDDNSVVHLTDGMAFAYGYIGMSASADIRFLLPAVTQYHLIYMELNKSVVPNTCTIVTKNNMAKSITAETASNYFRQDQLSTVKTGIFQIPLWQVEVNSSGVGMLTDLRKLKSYINYTVNSDYATELNAGGIIAGTADGAEKNNVTAVTQPAGTSNATVATTKFACTAIKAAVNGLMYYTITYEGVLSASGGGSDSNVSYSCDKITATTGETVTITAISTNSKYYVSGIGVEGESSGDT